MRLSSMKAFEEKREIADVLLEQTAVTEHLSPDEIHGLLDPHRYTGTAVQQVERLNAKLQSYLT